MAELDQIVKVVITRELSGASAKDFGTILLLSDNEDGTVAEYTGITGVGSDFGTNSPEYYAAQAIFGQNIAPSKILIGSWDKTAGGELIATALTNILNIRDDFYFVVSVPEVSASAADSAASWCKTNRRFFITATAESDVLDTTYTADVEGATPTIAGQLNKSGQNKSIVFWNSKTRSVVAGEESLGYPDAAMAAMLSVRTIGSYTAAYQQLSFVYVDSFTATQRSNAFAKNALIYQEVAGSNITREGRVPDGNEAKGEWIDIEIGIDWLYARIQEAIYTELVNKEKIPYTDIGVETIRTALEAVLTTGQENGLLDTFTTSAEKVADQSITDKSNRFYGGLEFVGFLAGAIHSVEIRGVVTY